MDVRCRQSDRVREETKPDQFYEVELKLIPQDYTLKAGHELWLVLYGTDAEFTVRPFLQTGYVIEKESLRLELPVLRCKTGDN